MKCVSINLNNEPVDIVIEIFSDMHIGSAKCDTNKILEKVEAVKNDPNRYAVILGDVINNSTKSSVGDVYSEPLSPMEQMKLAMSILEPIKDKILAVTSGNHERRTYKQDGIDLTYFLCQEFGITDRYDPAGVLLFLAMGKACPSSTRKKGKETSDSYKLRHRCSHNKNNMGQMTYVIYCVHGDGASGRLPGGKANALQRRGDIVNADVVLMGHTHMPLTFKDAHFEVDRQHRSYNLVETLYINGGSDLDYEEYAELMGLRPSSATSPKLLLSGRFKDPKCIL